MSQAPELHESITELPLLLADVGPFLLVRDPVAWERSGAAAVLALGPASGQSWYLVSQR